MATIKRYTDISQARILDEILLSKGADMFFKCFGEETYDLTFCEVSYSEWAKDFKKLYDKAGIKVIPCWSLSALLSILPKIHKLKPILDLEECSIQYNGTDLYIIASNPVDACYEMILKLHELNLL